MEKLREVVFYKSYFEDLFLEQRKAVKDKIIWTIELLEILPRLPESYLKYLENGIYELRVSCGGEAFRIFCFMEKNKMVVLMNGFVKKTQKTPRSEIDRALKIKKEYEQEAK